MEPQLPPALEGALQSLYRDYEAKYRDWEAARSTPTPPVFIVVCNNTTVSKLVFDWVAGWVKPLPTDTDPDATLPIAGNLSLFSNVVDDVMVHRPRTVLVDSAELESGKALSPEFKAAAATEIAALKADVARRRGAGAAEDLDDVTIMREVMNTVGKPGRLGEDAVAPSRRRPNRPPGCGRRRTANTSPSRSPTSWATAARTTATRP